MRFYLMTCGERIIYTEFSLHFFAKIATIFLIELSVSSIR
jgi:hypothetical protein